jgi:hypothetical protein
MQAQPEQAFTVGIEAFDNEAVAAKNRRAGTVEYGIDAPVRGDERRSHVEVDLTRAFCRVCLIAVATLLGSWTFGPRASHEKRTC